MSTSPRIYVACLASYNAGKLHGAWIEIDSEDQVREEIAAMLRASPEPNVTVRCPCCEGKGCWNGKREPVLCVQCKGANTVPSAEEFAIHDYEGFGEISIREYDPISRVVTIALALAEHDPEVVATALEHLTGGPDLKEIEDWISDHYAGTFRTLEDWAEEFLDDTGAFAGASDTLKNYFNYERYARDCEIGGDIFTVAGGAGVHVFWNH